MRIDSGSIVLLDTVALIYWLEGHDRYAKAIERIMLRVEQGELQGLISSLLLAEILVPFYRHGRSAQALSLIADIRNFPNLQVKDVSPALAAEAARLRAAYGLRIPDAIHAATATICKATGILTNDKNLGCLRAEGLAVWLFDQL